MRRKKVIGVISAIALAAIGTFALTTYVRTAKDRAVAGEELVEVYVADKPVPAGTPAEDIGAYLRKDFVPAKVRPKDAIVDLSEVNGLVASVDLLEGEQILKARFSAATVVKQSAGTGACRSKAPVPAGMHEISITLDAIRALGGNLKAGSTVALNVSFDADGAQPATTKMVLHKLLVTCVASTLVEEAPTAGAAPVIASKLIVNFAVDAANIEKVVFATEYGKVWLSAEPKDAPEPATQPQTRQGVVGKDVR